MRIITDLFLTAFYTVFIQNFVLSSGLGVSEAIRVSTKPGTFVEFALMISGFSVLTSGFCGIINMIPAVADFSYALRALIYGLVLATVYLIVSVIAKFVFDASKKLMSTLGIAALNTLVFAIPYINSTAAYSFAGSIGSGLGAGIAFVLAATLINKGSRFIEENEEIPAVFRGTPAMFFYVAIISLAFAGFTDTNIFG